MAIYAKITLARRSSNLDITAEIWNRTCAEWYLDQINDSSASIHPWNYSL